MTPLPDHVQNARKEILYTLLNQGYTDIPTLQEKYPLAWAALENFYHGSIERAKKDAEDFAKQKIKFRMVGDSEPFKKLVDHIEKVLYTDSTVLITGETGTGKNLVAEAIHAFGSRGDKPFVVLDVSGYKANPEMLCGEVFGRKRGAYTGADRDVEGAFELANFGVIYLNEIGVLDKGPQSIFLRIFDDDQIQPLGGRPLKVNVKIIASTNENLEKLVDEGRFREDLYYRLYENYIHVPTLRERKEDIPLLVKHFLKKYNKKEGKNLEINEQQITRLSEYPWPGNIRELENLIKRYVISGEMRILAYTSMFRRLPSDLKSGLKGQVSQFEKRSIMDALRTNNWNMRKTAQALKMTPRSLRYNIKKYEIKKE